MATKWPKCVITEDRQKEHSAVVQVVQFTVSTKTPQTNITH